jgi:hypothetical protein
MRSTGLSPAAGSSPRFRFTLIGALLGLLVSQVLEASGASASTRATPSASLTKQLKKLQRRVAALEAKGIPVIPTIPTSLPPSGPAGGALAGDYPNPALDVNGGPCPNGRAVTNVSAQAALTCRPAVYSDANGNVAAGPTAFPALAGGAFNDAIGQGALQSNTSGSSNIALGQNALFNNVDGSSNSAVGSAALFANTSGNEGTALGAGALASNNGFRNTAVGKDALDANTVGANNVAAGGNALGANQTGNSNTALGQGALQNTTGGSNIAVGANAGNALTADSGNIDIGNPGIAGESNAIRIGTPTQTQAFITGIDNSNIAGGVPVVIGNDQLGVSSSSRRVKRDIRPLVRLEALMKLRPVSFRYRTGVPELHYGLLAEQVAKVLPTLAVKGSDGRPESVQYQELPVLLLAKIQDQQRRNNALRAENRRQQAQIDWLMRHSGGR